MTQTLIFGDGYGLSRFDLYVTSLIDKLHGWQRRADELSETTKVLTVLGSYIRKYHGSHYYGKAINLARRLTAAYDAVLNDYDLLLMPTVPMKATKCLLLMRAERNMLPERWNRLVILVRLILLIIPR